MEDSLKEIFKDYEEIHLNKTGFTVTFQKGTDVFDVFKRLTNLLEKIDNKEKEK